MRTITIRWRRVIASVILTSPLGFALSGCGVGSTKPVDLKAAGAISSLTCDAARAASDAVAGLDASSTPGQRAGLKAWGLDPSDHASITAARDSLQQRTSDACNRQSSPTSTTTTTSSQTSTATASATTAKAETAGIVDADGTRKSLPLVTTGSQPGTTVDTSRDTNTPVSIARSEEHTSELQSH